MIAEKENALGIGLFSPAEAALYARVRTQTVGRWLFGDKIGERAIAPQLPPQDEKIVTFMDFVQILAVRALRTLHQVPLEKIRQAVDVAREQGVDFPFAMRHTTYLFGDPGGKRWRHGAQEKGQSDIALDVDGKFIQASGVDRRNLLMRPVAEIYMRDISFDPHTGLANEYIAWQRGSDKIVMNPHRRFGEPVIMGCDYTASTLWDAYQIEGGIEAAAKAYGVENKDVELACAYYDHLLNNSA